MVLGLKQEVCLCLLLREINLYEFLSIVHCHCDCKLHICCARAEILRGIETNIYSFLYHTVCASSCPPSPFLKMSLHQR